ncbi:MAG TPA: glycosyltransferase family 4 protein [Solirubrobacteraceae bacterium]|nr:glycosyltransferase family 4 protein [Solirubrobacteraceae bacterium]
MTSSTEPPSFRDKPDGPLDARWRAAREGGQEAVLPSGRVAVSCSAPFGHGGLGRHLQEIVDALARREQQAICICDSLDLPVAAAADRDLRMRSLAVAAVPLARLSPAWRAWRKSVAFDADGARRLPAADHLIAFSGQALAQFRAARRQQYRSISLMSATTHLRRVVRQHARAYRQYPLERSWASRLLRRSLVEYAEADRIYVSSRYSWESFVEEGVAEEAMSLFPLIPAPRFGPGRTTRASATFDIVYVGGLSVAKGVPLLIDAVRRLSHADMRLVLVGGAGTRGMRRFIESARARDSRIEVSPGDPLPHVRGARLCVHPSYSDGFGYSPAEALACGLPVIVSEDTGMKDLIDSGRDGLILPTGDLGALTEAIDCAYRGEILGG